MDSTVIVAIPSDHDKVWQLSSEKIPHLTICFLGPTTDVDQLDEIVQFVEHATRVAQPFGLSVDHRGTLGPDDADVIFFEDDHYGMKKIREFRAQLLQNDAISRAYASQEQYPQWTPHLTLGYPESPANPDDPTYPGLYYVDFDRIAVWTGDFDGPEFRLRHNHAQLEVSMSDTMSTGSDAAADILAHFGKKGMKWGVRNDQGHEGESAKTKKIEKLDKKFDRNSQTLATRIKLHNAAAVATNKNDVERINNKPEYKDQNFRRDSPLRQKYYKEHQQAYLDNLHKAADAAGTNASGTKQYHILEREDGSWDVVVDNVQHSDLLVHADLVNSADVVVEFDENGYIIKLTVPEEGEIKHYGVKGMKWGVTTKDNAPSVTQTREKKALRNTKDVTVTQRKAGTYVKTKGGQRQKASEDAVKAQAGRQKAKKSTTDSLSNKELKDTIERMRLEQEFAKLDKRVSRRGRGFINQLLQSPAAKQAAEDLLAKSNKAS